MSRFELTPRALADMDAIADYTLAQWSPKQAEKYLSALDRRFAWLARNPMLGRDRSDVAPGYRSFREGMHLVFYIIDGAAIRIIGVPHVAMDIDAYFG